MRVGPEFRFWKPLWYRPVPTSDPFLQPVSSPTVFVRRATPTLHIVNAYLFFGTYHRTSTPLWCSPRRVSHAKLADEYFRSMERRGQCDGIWLGVLGEIAIQNFQASGFKPYRAVGDVCLCVLLILEVWQRPFREQSHGWRWDLGLATGASQHLSRRNASG